MKIVIAVDSFKGSMSSMEAGNAAKAGILRVCDAEIVVKPLGPRRLWWKDWAENMFRFGSQVLWGKRRRQDTVFLEMEGLL